MLYTKKYNDFWIWRTFVGLSSSFLMPLGRQNPHGDFDKNILVKDYLSDGTEVNSPMPS